MSVRRQGRIPQPGHSSLVSAILHSSVTFPPKIHRVNINVTEGSNFLKPAERPGPATRYGDHLRSGKSYGARPADKTALSGRRRRGQPVSSESVFLCGGPDRLVWGEKSVLSQRFRGVSLSNHMTSGSAANAYW